ncbi:MAG: hypothetical protein CM1200mP30_12180 [Pseudomonadota bacterium]|nr:MAG: hypothetical protein CM1200mP30_12180 [Pseudomonadota bacterium]
MIAGKQGMIFDIWDYISLRTLIPSCPPFPGRSDPERGWGLAKETWSFRENNKGNGRRDLVSTW